MVIKFVSFVFVYFLCFIYSANAAFVFALGTEAADTPQQQTRAREGVSFARAWSQDFFAALTGTQPPNP